MKKKVVGLKGSIVRWNGKKRRNIWLNFKYAPKREGKVKAHLLEKVNKADKEKWEN